MKQISTADFVGSSKLARWNEIVAEVFVPLETRAQEPERFEGAIESVRLGDVNLAQFNASPARILRTPRQAAAGRMRYFLLHLQLDGELSVAQAGRETRLCAGDMALCDSALPFTLECHKRCSTLVMIVPANEIRRRLPAPDFAIGRLLSGSEGLSATLSVMLRSIWNEVRKRENDAVAARVGEQLIDMLATVCVDTFDTHMADSAVASSRRGQIRCYIETNLRDPELSVASIAAAFRISPRYLHMLFADEGETVSEFVRRRRLEECRKRLADKTWRNQSVTELAYAWGFNNANHFARVFRERFGASPRDFRNASLAQSAA